MVAPETGFGEINRDVLDADFWTTSSESAVEGNFRLARENEAARAADATACIDTSVGIARLKIG